MKCINCNSDKIQAVSNTYGDIKPRGFVSSSLYMITGLLTLGLLTSGSKGKIETQIKFACLDCGQIFDPPNNKNEEKLELSYFFKIFFSIIFPPLGILFVWMSKKSTVVFKIIMTVILVFLSIKMHYGVR